MSRTSTLDLTGDDALITRNEFCAFFKISVATADRWARLGIGPRPIRIGGGIRYRVGDCRAVSRGDAA